MFERSNGILYVVATPIGNLNDFSQRAINTLKEVSQIACEDTRRTQILLNHFGISTRLQVLQDHNEREVTLRFIDSLQAGESIALVSDAGTPLISDPGFRLVQAAHQAGIKVIPIPGACAAIAALSALGLPSDCFTFYGFLPAKHKQRCDVLKLIKSKSETAIFYEAPHRLKEALSDIVFVLGENRLVGIGREMTKQFEQIEQAPAGVLLERVLSGHIPEKGECVLAVAGEESKPEVGEVDRLLKTLLSEIPLKSAVKIAQQYFNLPKNEVYAKALELSKS